MLKKASAFIIFIALILTLFFSAPTSADASILSDFVDKVKSLIPGDKEKNLEKKQFSIESKIELAEGGDVNKNQQIDSGDFIRLTYTVHNPSNNKLTDLNINTNLNRKLISSIRNISGATGFKDDTRTIVFTNVNIYPKQSLQISFDARVNYSTKKDLAITTEPSLTDKNRKVLLKSVKKEINAKKMDPAKFKKMVDERKIGIN